MRDLLGVTHGPREALEKGERRERRGPFEKEVLEQLAVVLLDRDEDEVEGRSKIQEGAEDKGTGSDRGVEYADLFSLAAPLLCRFARSLPKYLPWRKEDGATQRTERCLF